MQDGDGKDEFAARLRRVRTERGLTHAELAELLGCTGGTISQYERGVIAPQSKRRKLLERWMDDEHALDEPPEISLLPARLADIERRVAEIERQVVALDRTVGTLSRMCNKVIESLANLGSLRKEDAA